MIVLCHVLPSIIFVRFTSSGILSFSSIEQMNSPIHGIGGFIDMLDLLKVNLAGNGPQGTQTVLRLLPRDLSPHGGIRRGREGCGQVGYSPSFGISWLVRFNLFYY